MKYRTFSFDYVDPQTGNLMHCTTTSCFTPQPIFTIDELENGFHIVWSLSDHDQEIADWFIEQGAAPYQLGNSDVWHVETTDRNIVTLFKLTWAGAL